MTKAEHHYATATCYEMQIMDLLDRGIPSHAAQIVRLKMEMARQRRLAWDSAKA